MNERVAPIIAFDYGAAPDSSAETHIRRTFVERMQRLQGALCQNRSISVVPSLEASRAMVPNTRNR
jgi:hypothetical protein